MKTFDRSTVKHGTQNIQNDCHQCLSDSFRVHRIRLRPDLTGGAYSAPTDPSAGLRGPIAKAEGELRERERERRRVEEGNGRDPPSNIPGSALYKGRTAEALLICYVGND